MTQPASDTPASTRTTKEFWVSSAHHMTVPSTGGGLKVTDELLLTWLSRPELVPPDEACDAERRLHADLMTAPRRPVSSAMIDALADEDARENWRFMVALRDRLIHARSIEAAYAALARKGASDLPPVFLQQLAHLILRHALDGCEDPFVLRAAECFFRPQKASLRDGVLLLADLELVEGFEADRKAMMHASPLTAMLGGDDLAQLDVMTEENAGTYWSCSDAHSFVMNIGGDPRSRDALARVIETWVRHMTGVAMAVEPTERITDQDWRWFVGLDAEATAIGNALWRGEQPGPDASGRVVALFEARILDAERVDPRIGSKPFPLIGALSEAMVWRIKPQNLVAGLPLRQGA